MRRGIGLSAFRRYSPTGASMNSPSSTLAAQRAEQFRSLPPDLTIEQVAHALGINYGAAYEWGRRLGYAFQLKMRGPQSTIAAEQFRSLPPNLTIAQVAHALGISYGAAYKAGRRLGYAFQLNMRGFRSGGMAKMKQLPPNLTVRQVMRQLKIPLSTASNWIRQSGYAFQRLGVSFRWNDVDWSQTNRTIAKAMGVTAERARQVRAELGKPRLRPRQRSISEHLRKIHALPRGLTIIEVARRLRVSYGYAGGLARQAGYACRLLHRKVPLPRWRTVNWSLSNTAIGRVLGVSFDTVDKMRRRLGKPPVDGRQKVTPEQWRRMDWSQSDIIIAKKFGLAIPYVQLKRRRRHLRGKRRKFRIILS
jgi:hypothetical protein